MSNNKLSFNYKKIKPINTLKVFETFVFCFPIETEYNQKSEKEIRNKNAKPSKQNTKSSGYKVLSAEQLSNFSKGEFNGWKYPEPISSEKPLIELVPPKSIVGRTLINVTNKFGVTRTFLKNLEN